MINLKCLEIFLSCNDIPCCMITIGRMYKHKLNLGYCFAFSNTSANMKASPFCGHSRNHICEQVKYILFKNMPLYNKVIFPYVMKINIQRANQYTKDKHNKWSFNPCIRFRKDHDKRFPKLHMKLNGINCRIIYGYCKEFTEPQIKEKQETPRV